MFQPSFFLKFINVSMFQHVSTLFFLGGRAIISHVFLGVLAEVTTQTAPSSGTKLYDSDLLERPRVSGGYVDDVHRFSINLGT